MTAHDVSDLNHDALHSDNLCAVIDRAYIGIASTQKFADEGIIFTITNSFTALTKVIRYNRPAIIPS